MNDSDPTDDDPEIDRINLRISKSFLEVIDETWRERGFNSRNEFIRYALRESVNHPEGAGFWRDMAISEADIAYGRFVHRDEVMNEYGFDLD